VKFLQAIGTRWNISLFHYRNHGSDYGRVLAESRLRRASARSFVDHRMSCITRMWRNPNAAYRMFLGA